jgi:tRNA 2-thiouridine synthesizing protein A
MKHDQELDASGLACPVPIVKTKQALGAMRGGQVLRVVGTDPGTVDDMPSRVEAGGRELLPSTRQRERFVLLIRKG